MFGFCGHRDATVDVDQQVLHAQRQAADALHRRAGCGGLQGHKVALGVVRIADQRQTEIHVAQAQAHGRIVTRADAGEGLHAAATDGDQLRRLDLAAIRQRDRLAALLDGEAAFNAEETKQIQRQGGRGFDHFALGSREAQAQAVFAAGGDQQIGLAGAVVHHRIAHAGRLVDGHGDVGSLRGQAFNAFKGQAAGGGLQGGPAARWVGLAGQQGQTKLGTAQGQAHRVVAATVYAHKGVDVAASDQQGVGHHRGGVRQHQAAAGALETEEAVQAGKAKHAHGHLAGCAHQFAQRTIAVQGHAGAGGTRGHLQLLTRKIHHPIGCRTHAGLPQVDLHRQVCAAGGDALDAHKSQLLSTGFEAGELARRGVGCHLRFGELLRHQGQAQVHALQRQTDAVGRIAVDTYKGVHAAGANGQQVHRQLGGRPRQGWVFGHHAVVQHHLCGAPLNGKATGHLQEAKGVQAELAAGAQQFAVGAIQAQVQGAAGARCHADSGLAIAVDVVGIGQAVVHHRATGDSTAVDGQGDVAALQRQAVHTHQTGAGGFGL